MSDSRDYVNEFNTVGQIRKKQAVYEYTFEGPSNAPLWTAKVYLGEDFCAEGKPQKTKRLAQASAAKAAIEAGWANHTAGLAAS